MISDEDADRELMNTLKLSRTPHGTVDNVMRVHSLLPSTMNGHVTLYRACLHDDQNTIPMWFQEVISSYVSTLNNCSYSYSNHWANACHLIADHKKAEQIESAFKDHAPEQVFEGAQLAILRYAEKLTVSPGEICEADIDELKAVGVNDGEILETATNINAILVLIGILGFIACFAFSLGPVMWVLLSELFPLKFKGMAIGVIAFINSLISSLVQLIFPWELSNLGNSLTFFIFGFIALIGFFILLKILPETKGKSLEELELSLQN